MIYFLVVIVVVVLVITYMVYLAHHDTIDFRTIIDEDLPGGFESFRVFFISDIHRRNLKQSTLNKITDNVDIIVIGGDLREKGVPFARTRNNLKMIKNWNKPIYFVWGNNDYEEKPETLYTLLKDEGIEVLANKTKCMEASNGERLHLVGLDCCHYREARFDLAIEGNEVAYTILITHDPSAFYELTENEQDDVDTVLAGHTHGGQIRIFGFGPFESGGFKREGNTNVFVSEGYGYTTLPFRLGTKSESHVLTFKQKI